MEATALLLEAKLLASSHIQLDGSKACEQRKWTSPTDSIVRSVYAAAFSRFVTGFCDTRQTTTYKQTMYEVAATIGMPVTFVDLRHECAHADPPSSRRLDGAVDQALAWLWEIYWSALGWDDKGEQQGGEDDEAGDEDDAVNGVSDNLAFEGTEAENSFLQQSLRAVLKRYLAARKETVRAHGINPTAKAQPDASLVDSTSEELLQICARSTVRQQTLQKILVETKMMVPSTEATPETMNTAYTLWDPLLTHLCRHETFLARLLRTFVSSLSEASTFTSSASETRPPNVPALSAWLLHVLKSDSWAAILAKHSKRDNGYKYQTQTVTACILSPTPPTVRIAYELVSSASASYRREWAPLVNACLPLLRSWTSDGRAVELEPLEVPSRSNDMAEPMQVKESHAAQGAGGEGAQHTKAGWRLWSGPWKPTPIGVVAS